ncbi:hypothetical protein [Streptomyces roseoviridis]|uniref:Uncharacterized protein n=1 Tax=Streptomyces roseoviridis TaxID=67361 RepID=A0ABV5QPH6_9ACTN
MSGGGGWWVLVESTEWAGDRWKLARTVPVDGGREAAVEQAAELARRCDLRGDEARQPRAYGRRVFRTSEVSWLVVVSHSAWNDVYKRVHTDTKHLRISVAELEHEDETPPGEPPAKKGVLRSWRRS